MTICGCGEGVKRGLLMLNLLEFRGISLIELMIGLGLASGLVLMDLERQKNNQVTAQSQEATESIAGLKSDLRSWLRQEGAISASFGRDGTPVTILTTPPANPIDREIIVDTTAITSISIPPPPGSPPGAPSIPMIARQNIDSVPLMGPVASGGDIRSLDNAGWTYIKTMWIQDFQEYDSSEEDLLGDGPPDTTLRRGSANLKVLLWKFTNLLDNPGLDCSINKQNCEREVITLPLDLRIVDSTAEGLTLNSVYDGTFGLQCRSILNVVVNAAVGCTSPDVTRCCRSNEFFSQTRGVDDKMPDGSAGSDGSIDAFKGNCCRFVQ